jgi:vitellogenic carboxypeptidase-like protein
MHTIRHADVYIIYFIIIYKFILFQYNAESAPVLLWLQGGPGGSSLFGLFNEHGPFAVKRDLSTLRQRSTTWALTHNLLYIDNPVGTGESGFFQLAPGVDLMIEEMHGYMYDFLSLMRNISLTAAARDIYRSLLSM